MSATVALRHQARTAPTARLRRASRLAEEARLTVPPPRHRARAVDEDGNGREIVLTRRERAPMAVVARLWLGVLSIFALIVFLGLVAIILGAWAFGLRPVVVTSGSMDPGIRTGDVVITRPIDAGDELGAQTVVDFDDPVTDERVLHRVIEVTPDGYRTKGDANPDPDPELVPAHRVHGAGLVLAPYVGYVAVWVQERAWLQLALLGTGLVALATMSRRAWMWEADPR
jgi:signal peptidase I